MSVSLIPKPRTSRRPAPPAPHHRLERLANPPAPEHRAPTAIPPGATIPNLLAYAFDLVPLSPAPSRSKLQLPT